MIPSSGNVALYPALAAWPEKNRLLCAWYEYGSAREPARSDVWYSSMGRAGDWEAPVNVSAGESYNNGPSILPLADGRVLLAWHSWRPPGREPFVAEGNVSNIWFVLRDGTGAWTAARQALIGADDSRYPSLAQHPDGSIWMSFVNRVTGAVSLARTEDLSSWEQVPVPEAGAGRFPDLLVDAEGYFRIAFIRSGEPGIDEVWLSESADGWAWSTKLAFRLERENLSRPTLSSVEGRVLLCCHTSTWGAHQRKWGCTVTAGSLRVAFSAADGHFWALNSFRVTSAAGFARDFSFGPDVFPMPKGVVCIGSENSLYDQKRGSGFDKRPRELLRELGDERTRKMIYSDEERTFTIDCPNGEYVVEAVFSSWIASEPYLEVAFPNCVNVRSEGGEFDRDRLLLLDITQEPAIPCSLALPPEVEQNRPSKVVSVWDRRYLAWTLFSRGRQGIALCEI